MRTNIFLSMRKSTGVGSEGSKGGDWTITFSSKFQFFLKFVFGKNVINIRYDKLILSAKGSIVRPSLVFFKSLNTFRLGDFLKFNFCTIIGEFSGTKS